MQRDVVMGKIQESEEKSKVALIVAVMTFVLVVVMFFWVRNETLKRVEHLEKQVLSIAITKTSTIGLFSASEFKASNILSIPIANPTASVGLPPKEETNILYLPPAPKASCAPKELFDISNTV